MIVPYSKSFAMLDALRKVVSEQLLERAALAVPLVPTTDTMSHANASTYQGAGPALGASTSLSFVKTPFMAVGDGSPGEESGEAMECRVVRGVHGAHRSARQRRWSPRRTHDANLLLNA